MRAVMTSVLGVALCGAALAAEAPAPVKKPRPLVEVVFVLDTTGSMGRLIAGAKQKIWSIANQIVAGTPRPNVRFGLVGYRDKGDKYVTKVFDLTTNIDAIYEHLMAFRAEGGGDGPEHVNRALAEAVEKITWTPGRKALKIIFLVGDWPPHMDYKDGYDYRKSAKQAITNGIIINTVRCGNHAQTGKVWREIADLAEGTFVSIDQSGGVQAVSTPMDGKLAALSRDLDETRVVYGSRERRREAERLHAAVGGALAKPEAAAPAADRVAFKATSGRVAEDDLLDAIRDKRVDLEKLDEKELPEKLQKMTKAERKKYLDGLTAKRQTILAEIKALNTRRQDYIKKELAKRTGKGDAFDEQVLKMLRKQAAKKGITY